jgi:peptidoglycan-associated lipoprotein
MKTSPILLALVVTLGLSACSNPDRFGADGGAGGGFGSDLTTQSLGSPSDPTSIAHFQQVIGDRVLFAVDQSDLSAEAMATLSAQAEWLRGNGRAVVIEGHADERGTREYNLALGARRAASVQEYLVAQGVAPGQIRTVSYGKERPLEVCSTESCYAVNRRAVTVVAGGAGS